MVDGIVVDRVLAEQRHIVVGARDGDPSDDRRLLLGGYVAAVMLRRRSAREVKVVDRRHERYPERRLDMVARLALGTDAEKAETVWVRWRVRGVQGHRMNCERPVVRA